MELKYLEMRSTQAFIVVRVIRMQSPRQEGDERRGAERAADRFAIH
jgi:hypothetical protein